jgi:Zn-dependent metalloprotease
MLRQALGHLILSGITFLVVVTAGSTAWAFAPMPGGARALADEDIEMQAAPPTAQAELAWEAFLAADGREFTATWNAVTATPHRVQGGGVKLAAYADRANIAGLVRGFVRSNAGLLAAGTENLTDDLGGNLRLLSQENHAGRWYTDYQQTYAGLDVVGGRVHVRVREDGTVTAFGSDFYGGISVSPVAAISEASAVAVVKDETRFDDRTDLVRSTRLVLLPVVRDGRATYRLAYEIVAKIERDVAAGREPAVWRVYVDAATGDVLRRINDIRFDSIYGAVSGDVKPMYITDPDSREDFAAHYVGVTGYAQDTTDVNGYYSIEAGSGGLRQVTAMIRGRWASVTNNGGAEASFADSVAPGTQRDIVWSSANSIASERNAYYHAWAAHQKIKDIDLSFTGMDRQTPFHVNEPNYCNGYWDGNMILLGAGYGACLDLAMFSDVIYHEYGHGVTDKQYGALSPSGAMHEAFSDYFACTITDEPYIGEGIAGPGSYFRNCANTLTYPDDLTGEVHDDGRILAGALWDLRVALAPNARLADSLFHYARYAKADNFIDYYYDVLETDDDDGNLANGTPHLFEIAGAFGAHGIGPGLYIDIAHQPIGDSEDSLGAFTAVAAVTSNLVIAADSTFLYYSTGAGFTRVAMTPTGNPSEYSAGIPAQAYGTTITYYIHAEADGNAWSANDPPGAPAEVHTFVVGSDTAPPVVSHVPLTDQPDEAWPTVVTATVTDNLGLASVLLEYFRNGVEQTPVAMTNVPGTDVYEAAFQVAASAGDYIEYRIVATDASQGANITYEPPAAYGAFGIADAQAYRFETGAEGWTHWAQSGWTDQWHVSVQRNHTPGGGQSWKCGDAGSGQYANRLGALLETPTLDIGEDATLTFWYWIDAEPYEPVQGSGLAWDGAAISLVDSAGKVTPLEPVGGYPCRIVADSDAPFTAGKPVYSGQEGWTMAVFDLSHYRGRGKMRFKFGSDGGAGAEGWYIDDVMIWSQGALAGVGPCDDSCPAVETPHVFALANPLPNPSASKISISYSVASPGSHVSIQVFDVRGRLASNLVDEVKAPGLYVATWDGRDTHGSPVSPGVYFARMEAKDFRTAAKVVVTR